MPITYDDFASKPRSEKLILCHVEPIEKLIVFSNVSGNIYKKSVNYFVIDVKEDGTSLTEASSSSVTTGEWYYDSETGEVYLNCSDDLNPNTHQIIVTYRLFYANKPLDLPYDLASGAEVHYDGRLRSNSPIRRELDDEQIGIVLESSTNVSLENADGYFDDIYDTLIFENKPLKVWSWSETLALSEKKKLFDGEIQDKQFSTSDIKFNCKDFVYKLRRPVSTSFFSSSDGDVPERYLNTPKRRLFGRFKQLRTVPIDSVIDGFNVTGTVSGASGQAIVTGSGSSFLDELSPDDSFIYNDGNKNYIYSIQSVDSDTQITLDTNLEITLASASVTAVPKIPWRKKNRSWHIAGHKLRAPSTTVSAALDARRVTVADISEFFSGDLIQVNGEDAFITRTSVNDIVLTANLQGGIPSVSDAVTKNSVQKVYINGNEAIVTRDWTVTNGANDAILVLTDTAERNIATTKVLPSSNITFTNSSRTVSVTDIDFRSELKPRDWIRSDDVSHTTWYEVLDVAELSLTLRVAYAGGTQTSSGDKKNIDPIGDDSIVTVDCLGQERSSAWVGNAAEAVKDMLENDLSLTNINTSSFTTASSEADFPLSIAIPTNIGGSNRTVRDVISDINKSVFGSLVIDSDFNLNYNILTPDKPETLEAIKDDDIIGEFSVRTRNETIRKVNAKYSHYIDKYTGDNAYELYEYTNTFVDDFIGAQAEMDIDIYLYNLTDVKGMAQRYALYNSMGQSTVTVKGKLNLALKFLNDKIFMQFDRLFKRFGGGDRRKMGIVSKVVNDGQNVTLEINDLGNSFNRVAAVSPNTANAFTSATDDEKIKNGYIVDTTTELPDTTDDTNTFTNLIG